MAHLSAKESLLTRLPSPRSKNASLSAMRWRTASGSPSRRPMITASSMRSAMTSLTARPALQEKRSVLMDIRVSMNVWNESIVLSVMLQAPHQQLLPRPDPAIPRPDPATLQPDPAIPQQDPAIPQQPKTWDLSTARMMAQIRICGFVMSIGRCQKEAGMQLVRTVR